MLTVGCARPDRSMYSELDSLSGSSVATRGRDAGRTGDGSALVMISSGFIWGAGSMRLRLCTVYNQ